MTMNTSSKVIKPFLPVFFTFYVFKEFTTAVAELQPDLYFWNGDHGFQFQFVMISLKGVSFWYAAGRK